MRIDIAYITQKIRHRKFFLHVHKSSLMARYLSIDRQVVISYMIFYVMMMRRMDDIECDCCIINADWKIFNNLDGQNKCTPPPISLKNTFGNQRTLYHDL